jgi:hypothetical protein
MRNAAFLAAAICLAVLVPTSPGNATIRPAGIESSSPIIDVAGPRCGPRAHYVRGHRARNGQWIKGRCIRDRRR